MNEASAGAAAGRAREEGTAAGHAREDGTAAGHAQEDGTAAGRAQEHGTAAGHAREDGAAAGHAREDGTAAGTEPVLALRHAAKAFGAVQALADGSIELYPERPTGWSGRTARGSRRW